MEIASFLLFFLLILVVLSGYPVALVLGGLSVIVGYIYVPDFLDLLPMRIMGVMENQVLIAVPLFIYMGLMLEKSGLAETLLETMASIFGRVRGGLAISVMLVGALLAASTGIVGATVVTMGLISLPVMLKNGYRPELATGVIASSGTLGQIIPPSVVLVILGSVMNVSVGSLFKAALIPGVLLVAMYLIYISFHAFIKPEDAPPLNNKNSHVSTGKQVSVGNVFMAFLLPIILMVTVLGSIYTGIASPTEAAGIGALGAVFLALSQSRLNWRVLRDVSRETSILCAMIFLILLGATTFSLVFRGMGGEKYLVDWIAASQLSPIMFLLLAMLVVFLAGFFIDFIEIVFIFVPIIAPVCVAFKMDLVWVGILLALNLQTSFLTPPFGFSLFYLKGVAPKSITTAVMYKGIIPFLLIQLLLLLLILVFPQILFYR